MSAAAGLRALYRRLHESMTPQEQAAVQLAIDALEEQAAADEATEVRLKAIDKAKGRR